MNDTQSNGQYTPPQPTVLAEVNMNAAITKRIAEEVMNQKTLLDVWSQSLRKSGHLSEVVGRSG